ncbi:MAG: YdcF family protein [Fibrobacteria bacterium]|nr:YdcF family protein [Fibrobacteria bacterium]
MLVWLVRAASLLLAFMILADFTVWFVGSRQLLDSPEPPPPDWIVVPGASVRRDGSLSRIMTQRMEAALLSARAWPQSRILLSGTSIQGGYSEPDAMGKWMLHQGIPMERIVLDRQGVDTRSTIRNLGEPGGSIVVVSQSWHLPRAVWSARWRGWSVRGLAAETDPPKLRQILREHLVRVVYTLAP